MSFRARLLEVANGLTPRAEEGHNPASARFHCTIGRQVVGREVSSLDDKLHQMLRDLRRALSDAISESTEVSRSLRKIREEGYSLYLLVDCKRDGSGEESLALSAPRLTSSADPAFQINGRDLSFLKSIGIDPTRRLRRRRVVD
jgi:hypothetical protein